MARGIEAKFGPLANAFDEVKRNRRNKHQREGDASVVRSWSRARLSAAPSTAKAGTRWMILTSRTSRRIRNIIRIVPLGPFGSSASQSSSGRKAARSAIA